MKSWHLNRIKVQSRKILEHLGIYILAVLIYTLILAAPISSNITGFVRNGEARVVIVLILLLYLTFKRSGRLGELWSLVLIMVLFAMVLSWSWNTGSSDGNLIGGLLPWSDASGYYQDAQRLLLGERFTAFASRRPLFTGMLSVLLGLTQQNLQKTLGIMGALNAIACYLLAREIRRTEGPLAGTILVIINLLFYRTFIGKTLTEHLGLMLGTMGLALIWHGATTHRKPHLFFGIMLLALALNARAGAFIVLPMLVVWGLWEFRKDRQFLKWYLVGSITAIFCAFLLNFLVLKIVGSPEGKAFSNFSYSLYGLASGYKSWSQVLIDHPQAEESEIYKLAFEQIQRNPLVLVKGIALAYQDFFNPLSFNAFSFSHFQGSSKEISYKILFLASSLGLLWCFLNFNDRRSTLMIALMIGLLLSVPFVPPIDSDSMRAYAVTIPLLGLLVGVGTSIPSRLLHLKSSMVPLAEEQSNFLIFPLAILIVALCSLAPILLRIFSSTPKQLPEKKVCPQNFQSMTLMINPGSLINLVEDSTIAQTHLPYVRLSDFKKYVSGVRYLELNKELMNIASGNSILLSINYQDPKSSGDNFLVVDSSQVRQDKGLQYFCVKITENGWLKNYHFYYADSISDQSGVSSPQQQTDRKWFLESNVILLGLISLITLEAGIGTLFQSTSDIKESLKIYSSAFTGARKEDEKYSTRAASKKIISNGEIIFREAIALHKTRPKHIKVTWILIYIVEGVFIVFLLSFHFIWPKTNSLQIIGTGQKNPSSKSKEVWVTGIWDGMQRTLTLSKFNMREGWEMRDSALLYNGNQPASVSWDGAIQGPVKLAFLSHPWSGNVTIRWNKTEQTIDLYSEEGKTLTITLYKDERERNLDIIIKIFSGTMLGGLLYMFTIFIQTLQKLADQANINS